ncbi:hypothetical protein MCUN1_000935 [Malassezia cuniculi]|uniref:Uncharacterized protein n=1 Tax=Malassezia cuniculi TaxID=948313 RepID=A0AAF0EWR8_9BASI|nr:hypothetical protein MCUN1_000935 [Malassezia cuniculi]
MLGLGTIFYFALLLINSIAILNEERFLAKIGWSPNSIVIDQGFGGSEPSVKARLVQLISALIIRDERRRRRRRQLAAAMLEADNDAILQQTELLAEIQPEAAAHVAMNFRFAHESAMLLHCDMPGSSRDVFIDPIQSMRALTYDYLGMAPTDSSAQTDEDSTHIVTPTLPDAVHPMLRTSASETALGDLHNVPERTSKLYRKVQNFRAAGRSISGTTDSDTSTEVQGHVVTDTAQLQSFRERVFDKRVSTRVVSGRRHSLASTSWPDDPGYPIGDESAYADVFGPPEVSVFESFDTTRDSDFEMQSGPSRASKTLADATRRMFRTSEESSPLAPMLQRRRTMNAHDHSSRKWLRPKKLVNALLGKNKKDDSGLVELDLDEPLHREHEAQDEAHDEPEMQEHVPIYVPAPLENTAFQYRTDEIWKSTRFFVPHGAFKSEGGIIVPHAEALPSAEEGTKQGPLLDIGPVSVPVQIGRRVLYPSTALFRNVLARHSDEHEGWGWEKYTSAAAFFGSLVADDSDSDDDEPLMEVRIHAREQRIAARRRARALARERRMNRDAAAGSESESGDASADADMTDPDAPWRDDLRPVGRLYGTNLIDIATLQDKERKALVRFYGQTNLDGGESLGLYDTRERMEQAFGRQTHWHNEMVARLQRDAMQTEDPELAEKSIAQLKELAAQVAAQTRVEPEPLVQASSPPQRRKTRIRRPVRNRETTHGHIDEEIEEWREDAVDYESSEESQVSEDDVPLAMLHQDSDDEDKPLGMLHPQAAIIAEQAALIRQLMAENQQQRMSLGMFGLAAPSYLPPQMPVPPWMQPRQNRESYAEAPGEQHEGHVHFDEQLEQPLEEPLVEPLEESELKSPVPLEHFAGDLPDFPQHSPDHGPAMAALMDPMVLDHHGDTSLAHAEAAAPVHF